MSEENTPLSPPPDTQPTPDLQTQRRQRSVIHYITVLFAAAFLLLLMTYVMDQRRSAQTIGDLTESVTDLRAYVSGMKSVEDLYDDNTALLEQVDSLTDRIHALEQDSTALQGELTEVMSIKLDLEKQVEAMDWFWQIDDYYVRGHSSTARKLIQRFLDAGLQSYLPADSKTDTGRFSPAMRFQEIYDALY